MTIPRRKAAAVGIVQMPNAKVMPVMIIVNVRPKIARVVNIHTANVRKKLTVRTNVRQPATTAATTNVMSWNRRVTPLRRIGAPFTKPATAIVVPTAPSLRVIRNAAAAVATPAIHVP